MTKRTQAPWRWLACLLAGALLAMAYALEPWAWAGWLAPFPLMLIALHTRPRHALGYGALTGVIASLSLLGYLSGLSSLPVALLLSLLRAAQWALTLGLTAYVVRRRVTRTSLFVLPATMAALDLLINRLSPHGSGGSLAYSAMSSPPVAQLAALGSTPLITFVLALPACALTYLLLYRRRALRPVALALALLIGLLTYGTYLSRKPNSGPTLRIATLASDLHEGVSTEWEPIWADYRRAMEGVSAEGVDVFLLPEKIFQTLPPDLPLLLAELTELSTALDAVIVIGIDERLDERAYNRAYFVAPDGRIETYDKIHMIPGFEAHFEIGTEPLIVDYQGIEIAIAICKDLDFPHTMRTNHGADLFLVPAWDFYDDDWFHSRMAMMRGIELGMPVARTARRGFLTFADSHGQIHAEIPSNSTDMALLIQDLPTATDSASGTVYGRFGDIFGLLAAALVSSELLRALILARQLSTSTK